MMNYRPGRALPPTAVALLPRRGTGQRNVDFFRFVPMSRVVGFGSEEQETARDPLAREWTAEAHELTPPVILQERSANFTRRVGLAPGHRRRGPTQGADQLETERGRISLYFREPTQNGEGGSHGCTPFSRVWPVREERS